MGQFLQGNSALFLSLDRGGAMCSIICKKTLTVLALATLMLTGCGGEEQPAQTLEPVTLRFGIPMPSSDLPSHLVEAIESFQQENSHITVETVSSFFAFDATALEQSHIDVYVWIPYSDPRGTDEERAMALSLEPFIAEDLGGFDEEDFFPLLLDAFRWEDELYALPAGADVDVMYYNRDMFDAQTVAYPQADWDWQDFFGAAQQLTTIAGEGEGQTGHWGFVCDPVASYLFVLQSDGMMFDDLLKPTQLVSEDPRVLEALQFYADLAVEYGVMPTPNELDRIPLDATSTFAIGRAAMWIGGISSRGGEADRMPWNSAWGAVPLPRGETGGNWAFPLGYFIAPQSGHPREAWSLVLGLSESESVWMPARRSVAGSDAFRQRVGPEVADAALAALTAENLVLVPPEAIGLADDSYMSQLWTLFIRSATDVVDGDITVERMMERLQERFGGRSLEAP
jgi:ABC-type glycerol-3-phosphate transport system substrate-binding protein